MPGWREASWHTLLATGRVYVPGDVVAVSTGILQGENPHGALRLRGKSAATALHTRVLQGVDARVRGWLCDLPSVQWQRTSLRRTGLRHVLTYRRHDHTLVDAHDSPKHFIGYVDNLILSGSVFGWVVWLCYVSASV